MLFTGRFSSVNCPVHFPCAWQSVHLGTSRSALTSCTTSTTVWLWQPWPLSSSSSSSSHSFHLCLRWVSSPPGRGASLPHSVSWAVSWLVRGGTAGGFYHRLTVGPGEAYHGKTERKTPGQWFISGWESSKDSTQIKRRFKCIKFSGWW